MKSTRADDPAEEEASAKQRAIIKTKILAVGRMSRVFALLRYVAFLATGT